MIKLSMANGDAALSRRVQRALAPMCCIVLLALWTQSHFILTLGSSGQLPPTIIAPTTTTIVAAPNVNPNGQHLRPAPPPAAVPLLLHPLREPNRNRVDQRSRLLAEQLRTQSARIAALIATNTDMNSKPRTAPPRRSVGRSGAAAAAAAAGKRRGGEARLNLTGMRWQDAARAARSSDADATEEETQLLKRM